MDAQKIKTEFAEMSQYLQDQATRYTALALQLRHADANTLRALVDENDETAMSLELLVNLARGPALGTLDRAILLVGEAMITRGRELGLIAAPGTSTN